MQSQLLETQEDLKQDKPASAKISLLVQKAWGSIPRPVKSDSVANDSLPLQCFFRGVLPRRLVAEMDAATR